MQRVTKWGPCPMKSKWYSDKRFVKPKQIGSWSIKIKMLPLDVDGIEWQTNSIL